ncbi:MAG: hypothetical protein Q9214_003128, partial [Letrouitia sp. 1 TL-2023]
NNMGVETRMSYVPSTKFYLDDLEAGRPWTTRLPFPVHCVKRVDLLDRVCGNRFMTCYKYSHGFFDGIEREFRGFGMVEKTDYEHIGQGEGKLPNANISDRFNLPPVVSRTWYHTGSFSTEGQYLCEKMARDFFGAADRHHNSKSLQQQFLSGLLDVPRNGLSELEVREAYRSLKGSMIRQEIYSQTGDNLAKIPFEITESNYTVRTLQRRDGCNPYGIFMAHPRETVKSSSERSLNDARVSHTMSLSFDDYGNELKSLSIVYGRDKADPDLNKEQRRAQERTEIMYKETTFTNIIETHSYFSIPVPCETKTYSVEGPLTGYAISFSTFAQNDFELLRQLRPIPFEYEGIPICSSKRLVEHVKTLFRSDDLSRLLPLGHREAMSFNGQSYNLAFTPGVINSIFCRTRVNGAVDTLLLPSSEDILDGQGAGYVDLDGDKNWWLPTARSFYHPEPVGPYQELQEGRAHFFTARRSVDPFGNTIAIEYDKYNQLLVRAKDAIENITLAVNDYRTLEPKQIIDPNQNISVTVTDELGLTVGAAVRGKKDQDVGDSLTSFKQFVSQEEVEQFMKDPNQSAAIALLGDATNRYIYNLQAYYATKCASPCFGVTLSREEHASNIPRVQISFMYYDGYGRMVQKKSLVGYEAESPNEKQWLGSGWTVFNNKANPVQEFQPFYDDFHVYRPNHKVGFSSIKFYDPLQRNVATLNADHTWNKTTFTPWKQVMYDANDLVLVQDPRLDPDVGRYFRALPKEDFMPTWYSSRIQGQLGDAEKKAAVQAAKHAKTPTTVHLDSKARAILTIKDNGIEGKHSNSIYYDTRGQKRTAVDAKGRIVEMHDFNVLGALIRRQTMDSGKQWLLPDANGTEFLSWDSREQEMRVVYDQLRRPTKRILTDSHGCSRVFEKIVYGESQPRPEERNLRGRVYQGADQSKITTSEAYDFKGNLLETTHQLVQDFKPVIDWSRDIPLEEEKLTTRTSFDALNKPLEVTSPDGTVTKQRFDAINYLREIRVWLPENNSWKSCLFDVEYNAVGQRTQAKYGNGTVSRRTYDARNYNLVRAYTRNRKNIIQDLNYTFDPMLNIIQVRDDAQEKRYFRNKAVFPTWNYTYDAIYRLVEETGREHIGQDGDTLGGKFGAENSRRESPENKNAVANYQMSYKYDSCNNMLSMTHISDDPGRSSHTKRFCYDEVSQLQPDQLSDKLSTVILGDKTQKFSYEGLSGIQGCTTQMPKVRSLEWDFADRLKATSNHATSTEEKTWYTYDASGTRVRKVTERNEFLSKRIKETIYIGTFELHRRYRGDGNTCKVETKTVAIVDSGKRIVLVETQKKGNKQAQKPLVRYQISNHLDSVTHELDEDGKVISYEEYSSFGDTTYQSGQSETKAPKRYRFAAKERDKETGLYYIGARYYDSEIGRWISSDPNGISDGMNVFCYAQANPVTLQDTSGREAHAGDEGRSWLQKKALDLDDWINSNPYAKGSVDHAGARGEKMIEGLKQLPNLPSVIANHPAEFGKAFVAGTIQLVTDTAEHAVEIKHAYDRVSATGSDKDKEALAGAITDTWLDIGDIILTLDGIEAVAGGGGKALLKAGSVAKSTLEGAARATSIGELVTEGAGIGSRIAESSEATKNIFYSVGKAGSGVLKESETVLPSLAQGGAVNAARAAKGVSNLEKAFAATGGALRGAIEAHHLFAQKYFEFFKAAGINIEDYLFRVDQSLHKLIHGKGGHLIDMEKEWGAFIEKNSERLGKLPDKGKKEILEYGQKLREKYGLGYMEADKASDAERRAYEASRKATAKKKAAKSK